MAAFYNEIDPYAAQWLRNLIQAGHIAPGVVETRSIAELQPADVAGFTQVHLFAGIGGWSLAARLAGWPDSRALWTGSCPCQPFSVAGAGKGQQDERHLWPEFCRLIAACRPDVIMGEQVAAAVGKSWLDGVYSDLESIGYATGAAVVPACAVDAPHRRDRLWFVADKHGEGRFSRNRDDSAARYRHPVATTGSADDSGARSTLANDGAGRRAGPLWRQGEQSRRAEAIGASDSDGLAHAHKQGLERRVALPERGDERSLGPHGMAHADGGERDGRTDESQWGSEERTASWWASSQLAVGADGKARRVKPGIRLLAHGIPARVGKLRAFGNAIVPQVAEQVLRAYLDCSPSAAPVLNCGENAEFKATACLSDSKTSL